MKIERPRLGGVFLSSSSVRRGDRFFPGTLFQDRHRRPAAGEPEKHFYQSEQRTKFIIVEGEEVVDIF